MLCLPYSVPIAGADGDGKEEFLPGVLVDAGADETRFLPGFLLGGADVDAELVFVAGQRSEDDGDFVPGQFNGADDEADDIFLCGQIVDDGHGGQVFLPGSVVLDPDTGKFVFLPGVFGDDGEFTPGLALDSLDAGHFVEGRLHKPHGQTKAIFIPGKHEGADFKASKGCNDIHTIVSEEISDVVDGASLSFVFKKAKPKNGTLVKPRNGKGQPLFFPDGKEIPADVLEAAGEVIRGRMETGDNGLTFVPGQSMELNGVKSFIPGKVTVGPDGSEHFVPGKVIQTRNGPKFVCGQVIQTEDGEKFLPGVVMEDSDGQKTFVPAMEIQTKSGPMLIPGQVSALT
jgi:hypothetical protein